MPSAKSKIRTVKLNKKNSKKFNERFKKGITIVGFFMKPKRCPHCDALKPTWNDLMRKYSALSSNMPCQLATSIQGTESLIDSLNDDVEIRGFPTIRVFRNGKKFGSDYNSERSMEALSNFIDNQFGIVMSGGRKYRKKLRTLKRKKKRRRKTRKKKRKLFFGLF